MDDPILEHLQDLLFTCVATSTPDDLSHRSYIPMYRFLVHKAIRDDGTYASTDSITQTIAQLQYITRAVILIEGSNQHV
jgi:hypothetical protein